ERRTPEGRRGPRLDPGGVGGDLPPPPRADREVARDRLQLLDRPRGRGPRAGQGDAREDAHAGEDRGVLRERRGHEDARRQAEGETDDRKDTAGAAPGAHVGGGDGRDPGRADPRGRGRRSEGPGGEERGGERRQDGGRNKERAAPGRRERRGADT